MKQYTAMVWAEYNDMRDARVKVVESWRVQYFGHETATAQYRGGRNFEATNMRQAKQIAAQYGKVGN